MSKHEDLDRDLKELLDMVTCTSGDVEDLDKEELRELLKVSGPSGDEITQEFYRKLKSAVEEMRRAGKPVPGRYLEALEQVRPLSEPTKDPHRVQSRARAWIEKMLGAVSEPPEPEVAVAFRNKGELSHDEQIVLEKAAEALKERLRKRRTK